MKNFFLIVVLAFTIGIPALMARYAANSAVEFEAVGTEHSDDIIVEEEEISREGHNHSSEDENNSEEITEEFE